jgi:hypothetical protein
MQKHLHVKKNRRILERRAAVSPINPIEGKTMKIIRVALLVMALALPVFAGEIPNGVKATGNIPYGVAAAGEMQNGVTATGDIQYGVTAAGEIQYGVTLVALLTLILP